MATRFSFKESPSDCGMGEIYGFPYVIDGKHACGSERGTCPHTSVNPSRKACLLNDKQSIISDLKEEIRQRRRGIFIVSINHVQKRVCHDLLLDVGFKEACVAYNPNSGNDITLYHYVKYSPEGAK